MGGGGTTANTLADIPKSIESIMSQFKKSAIITMDWNKLVPRNTMDMKLSVNWTSPFNYNTVIAKFKIVSYQNYTRYISLSNKDENDYASIYNESNQHIFTFNSIIFNRNSIEFSGTTFSATECTVSLEGILFIE